ncbi:MAG: energy transducer TonB [Thiogranum sp.]|nr:energy transducer TonB [Thiogranum sp.]
MNAVTENFHETSRADRLVVTLFLATAFHALVILGISFDTFDRELPKDSPPALDITVVTTNRSETPEDYDYLADSSQDGAGNTEERVKPREQIDAQAAAAASAPDKPAARPLLQQQTSSEKAAENPAEETLHTNKQTAAELVNRSLEMVALNEHINQSLQAYSKTPQSKYISARTKEFKYASYMRDWVSKVERVGELNFPDAARRADLSGSLIVEVALHPDGTVQKITILRPSGHKILDDAAVRIVRLASPFAAFPKDIREETDVLYITRTWVFTSGNQLKSK